MNKPVFIIVDAYSTGKYLAPAFCAQGYECIHIQSKMLLNEKILRTFYSDNFIQHFIFDGDFEGLIASLKNYDVKAIIPGYETGVRLADHLAHILGVPHNDYQLSLIRKNKYLLANHLLKKGLCVVPSAKVENEFQIKKWLINRTFPIIVKPISSPDLENFYLCQTQEEAIEAFYKLCRVRDQLGKINCEAFIQQYFARPKYHVSMISCNGRHYIVEAMIMSEGKIERLRMADRSSTQGRKLINYAIRAVNAVGITHGPSHTEIIFDKNEPILVETAARLMYFLDPSMVNDKYVSLLCEAYTNPESFLKRLEKENLFLR